MHGLSLFVFPGREESIRSEDMPRRVLGESQIPREEKGSISHNMFTLKVTNNTGFPAGLVVKNPPANAGDVGLIPGLGMIPWRRKWQPPPVFLVWRIPWTEEPGGLQSIVSKSWARTRTFVNYSKEFYVC